MVRFGLRVLLFLSLAVVPGVASFASYRQSGTLERWQDAPIFKQQMSGAQVFWHDYLWGAWDASHGLTAFNGTAKARAAKTVAPYYTGAPTLYATGAGLFAAVHAPIATIAYKSKLGNMVLGEQVKQANSNGIGYVYRDSNLTMKVEVMSGTFDNLNQIVGAQSGAVVRGITVSTIPSGYLLEWSRDGWKDFVPVTDFTSAGGLILPRQVCDCGIIKGPINGRSNVRVLLMGEYTEGNPTLYYCLPDVNIRQWVPIMRGTGSGTGDWPKSTQAIRHFHGEVFVPGLGGKEGRLLVMTGDNDQQSSILVCDDIADLCNNGGKWQTRWGLNLAGPDRVAYLTTGAGAPYCLCVGKQDCRAVDIVINQTKKFGYYVPDQASATTNLPLGANFLRKIDLTKLTVQTMSTRIKGEGWVGCLAPDGTVLISSESDFGMQGVKAYNGNSDEFVRLYALGEDQASLYEIARFRRADYKDPTFPSNMEFNRLSVAYGVVWGWDQQHNFELGDAIGYVYKGNHNP